MFTIYIAKAASNYGLPATRPIYERAIEVLPARQTAQMCLRFAALERKLGEIDRARAIYAHASQFCDPRTNPGFWAEWNAFEIDTGSEDTFREMLRIKRSVQAQFNTEASYLAAQTVSAEARRAAEEEGAAATADPMALAEKAAGGAPSFVAAKQSTGTKESADAAPADASSAPAGNAEEIHISDDEDL
jgi:pre-mRNA-splicing factor SYF1